MTGGIRAKYSGAQRPFDSQKLGTVVSNPDGPNMAELSSLNPHANFPLPLSSPFYLFIYLFFYLPTGKNLLIYDKWCEKIEGFLNTE